MASTGLKKKKKVLKSIFSYKIKLVVKFNMATIYFLFWHIKQIKTNINRFSSLIITDEGSISLTDRLQIVEWSQLESIILFLHE